jgi:hypothetical protein
MNIAYTRNQYQEDGRQWDEAILLHIDDTFILRLNNIDELDSFIDQLDWIKVAIMKEVKEKVAE